METGSNGTTERLSKAMVAENNGNKVVMSSKPAGLFKGRKKAGILQDKSFRKNLHRMITSRSNSENVAIDNSVREHGSKSMVVTPDVPLPTDPVMFVGHDEDEEGNTVILHESAKRSRIPEQERYVNLKARVKQLKEENHRLSRKLQEEAEISLQLKEENKILLDQLKGKCEPDIITSLEARDPDRRRQSNDD